MREGGNVTEHKPQEQRPQENPDTVDRAGKAATVDLPPKPNFVLNQPEGATPPDTQAQPTTQAAPDPPTTADGGD
jgi:hypothetical protein